MTDSSAELQLNKAGIKFFRSKSFIKALECFSKALKTATGERAVSLYVNRSAAYLAVDHPKLALEDAESGLAIEPRNCKLMFRKVTAYFALGQYQKCVQFIQNQPKEIRNTDQFMELVCYAQQADLESTAGKYDLVKMTEEAKITPELERHANYFPEDLVEIRDIPGFGRGLVAKTELAAGTLVIAARPFVFDQEISAGKHIIASHGNLILKLLAKAQEKLEANSELRKLIYHLSAGEKFGYLEGQAAIDAGVDDQRIAGILRINSFSYDKPRLDTGANVINGGLWVLPSYVNHSCVDVNLTRNFIGEFMFVRTVRKVSPGEQLVFQYCSADDAFRVRDKKFRASRGFACTCRLCEKDRSEPEVVLDQLDAIHEEHLKLFKKIQDGNDDKPEVRQQRATLMEPRMAKLLSEARRLRPDKALNLFALGIQLTLSRLYLDQGKIDEAIPYAVEAADIFQQLGLVTDALHATTGVLMCYRISQNVEQFFAWSKKVGKLNELKLGDAKLALMENE